MKFSTVFPILFLFISFVFSSPIPSAVDDIGTTVQNLFQKCPDSIPLCRSDESQKILITIRTLLEKLEHAAEDPRLVKPIHKKTGQALQKLSESLHTKTDNQDLEVGKNLKGLVHALAEIQGFLGEIENKASLPNIISTGEEILDKRSGVEPTQQDRQKAQGPEESPNGLGPRNLGTELGETGKNLGLETGEVGKTLGVVAGKTGKNLGVGAGGTGKDLGVGSGKAGKTLGVEAAKLGITVEELLAKLVSLSN